MPHNLYDTLQTFKHGKFYSIPVLSKKLNLKLERLPVSIRIVLESVLRNCDGKKVTEAHVKELAGWRPNAPRTAEIPFVLRASCCRTSPACRCSATWRRCAAWRRRWARSPR